MIIHLRQTLFPSLAIIEVSEPTPTTLVVPSFDFFLSSGCEYTQSFCARCSIAVLCFTIGRLQKHKKLNTKRGIWNDTPRNKSQRSRISHYRRAVRLIWIVCRCLVNNWPPPQGKTKVLMRETPLSIQRCYTIFCIISSIVKRDRASLPLMECTMSA